mgnify:CR=1 FL=1
MTFKLLSYNIRFGGSERRSPLAEVIKNIGPDLVVFQEASDPQVIKFLSDECGMPFWAARRRHSLGFISRRRPEKYEWHHPARSKHAFLEIQLPESEARVFGLHLRARFSKWSERRRHQEIKALLAAIKRHEHGFHALIGDFNTLAPGEAFHLDLMPLWIRFLIWASGKDIRRDTIQTILDEGYVDGFRRLFPDEKGYTFPVWRPHVRLDYIFLPERFADRLTGCEIVKLPPAHQASDHFPLLFYLDLPAGG